MKSAILLIEANLKKFNIRHFNPGAEGLIAQFQVPERHRPDF